MYRLHRWFSYSSGPGVDSSRGFVAGLGRNDYVYRARRGNKANRTAGLRPTLALQRRTFRSSVTLHATIETSWDE